MRVAVDQPRGFTCYRVQAWPEIRRRDAMYPTQELTAGAVQDRRTLLNIIDELEDQIDDLKEMLRSFEKDVLS